MDDISDIRLVDAHSEGYCGDNHVHILHKEAVLILRPYLSIQPGVIWNSLYTVDNQHIGKFFNLLSAEAVYNSGLPRILLYVFYDIPVRIHLVPDLVIEVRPVERGLEDLCVLYAEILYNVALDLRGGRGGERYHRSISNLVDYRSDAPVLRPEIVPPVGNAMSLVYRIERYPDFLQDGDILLLDEALGSHIEKFGDSGHQILADL